MTDLEKTLYDLCLPLVTNKSTLSVKTMTSGRDNEILLYAYADDEDIARLIGRKGTIASALRQMMSVAARDTGKRISVKFETF